MYGLFALGGAVNEDIEIVAAFGGNSDKLLIAAVIVNQCCVSLWGKGRRFLFSSTTTLLSLVASPAGGSVAAPCA